MRGPQQANVCAACLFNVSTAADALALAAEAASGSTSSRSQAQPGPAAMPQVLSARLHCLCKNIVQDFNMREVKGCALQVHRGGSCNHNTGTPYIPAHWQSSLQQTIRLTQINPYTPTSPAQPQVSCMFLV